MPLTISFVMLLLGTALSAQPLYSTQKVVNERVIFQDVKEKHQYYYGPGMLKLAADRQGQPVFQLISIRYTGTARYGDANLKSFTNLLQFTVAMEPMDNNELLALRQSLQLPTGASLDPLPVQNLEAVLVCGVLDEEGQGLGFRKRVAGQATAGSSGTSGKGVFWTERAFVAPLDNHEAQLLWDQQKNGRVALSLNYAFYAEAAEVQEIDYRIEGDSVFQAQLGDNLDQIPRDTQIIIVPLVADVLNIQIDADKCPGCLRQLDLNQLSIPPAYAALQVRCYDFAEQLRPEVALKIVEIEAKGISGRPVTIKTRFNSQDPEATLKYISFPYAVSMDDPIRYRYREMPFEGEPYQSPWYYLESGNLIDVTTPGKESPVKRRCTEIEVLPEAFSRRGAKRITLHFIYFLNGIEKKQTLDFVPEGPLLKDLCITFDKENGLKYFTAYSLNNGKRTRGYLKPFPIDEYILVK